MLKRVLTFIVTLGCLPLWAQNTASNPDTLGYMNQDPFNLEQVVVTATRTQKKIKDIPVITQVVTARQIADRGVGNIQELLSQEVPGLNFQEVGFGTDIDIQGLGSKHILFLIDGERIAGENGGNIDYSRINLYNVDHIEIVKGASSALYGSQAMGGVINIITRQPEKKVEVSAGIRYAQNNQKNMKGISSNNSYYKHFKHLDKPNLNGNISVGLNLGRFKMTTDVLYKSQDAYQLYDRKGIVKYFPEFDAVVKEEPSSSPTRISGYEDVQVNHKMSYQVTNKFKMQAHGSFYTLNKYDFIADNVFEKSQDYTYGMNMEYKFSPRSILQASFHADNYKRVDKFEKKSGERLEYKNNILQPRIIYTNSAVKNMVFTGGVEYYREELYSDKFETGKYESKSQAYGTMFIQDDWSISKKFSMVVGIRGDYHEAYGAHFTPKVSFMFKKFPFTVRLNYARGYRSPTIKELYMNWDHLGMFWIYGNANLEPETNNYVSLSGEYGTGWINMNVNIYGNWFRNKIEGMWTNNQKELHYVNVGKSHLAGAEAMVKMRLNKNFYLHGTYNYLYTSKDEGGVRLSSSSPHSGTVRLEYKTLSKKYQTIVNLTGSIMGDKDFDVLGEYEKEDGTKVESYYKAHLNAYSLWDLSISQYIARRVRITLGINNLFDFTADRVTFNTSTTPGRKFFVACNFTL